MEYPVTRVHCLTKSGEAEKAGGQTGLPTGLARDEKRFAVGRADYKAGHTTSCELLQAFPCRFTGTNSADEATLMLSIEGQKHFSDVHDCSTKLF